MLRVIRWLCCAATLLAVTSMTESEATAGPSAVQAMGLKPVQSDVDCDTPAGDELKRCTIDSKGESGVSGWYVRDGSGNLLRRFLDTDADNRIDLWCYYKGGIEVYRDVDSDKNGKADQYRWMGTAGIRWGMDQDEDGRVDSWKMISAEEATAEVVAALREADAARFNLLLLTDSELKSLGLSESRQQKVAEKVVAARKRFSEVAAKQKSITSESKWVNLGASRPGVVPAGTDSSTRDLIIYDNVSAIVETGSNHSQVVIGTLIQVGQNWRLIDAPEELSDASSTPVAGGFFFRAGVPAQTEIMAAGEGLSEAVQKLVTELEQIDRALETATGMDQRGRLNARRADVLEQLVTQSQTAEERDAWLRQLADGISAAVQSGGYPDGVARLKQVAEKIKAAASGSNLAAYLEFRYLSAVYAVALTQPEADLAQVQEQWLTSLQTFVQEYPSSDDASEAMLQLAVGHEFAGETEQAIAWYEKIVAAFPESQSAKKAAGAKRRLQSVGNVLEMYGSTMDGKTISLAALRGRVVLIHYWATWCEPCKQDLETLKKLQAKYARQGFNLIGINLDSERELAAQYLKSNPLPWPQLFEAGGLDGRLANELGVLTLPTMILLDKGGKVVNRNVHSGELDEALGKLLR